MRSYNEGFSKYFINNSNKGENQNSGGKNALTYRLKPPNDYLVIMEMRR